MKANLEDLTPEQLACLETLRDWVGGPHHMPRVYTFGSGISINYSGDLSTFDGSRLTHLVLLAHRDAVRIELMHSGPRMVKVIAHKRKPIREGLRFWEKHPTLADLSLSIEAMREKGGRE